MLSNPPTPTRLIANGVDIATVSKRLGHTKISVNIDTYTHLDMQAKEIL